MNEQTLEFAVVGVVDGEELFNEPYRAVIGRCGDVPIRLDDHFDAVVKYDEPKSIADYERDPIEVSRNRVDLTVKRIHAYGKDREMLERGMTGVLVLVGQGLGSIDTHSSLAGTATVNAGNGLRPKHSESEPARHVRSVRD
jgi:hypothetical protein